MSHFSTASESSTGRAAPGAGLELSIIIPAYNEEARIAPTLQAIAAFLHSSRIPAEVLVVDDGSKRILTALTDETGREVHSEKMVEIHFNGDRPVKNGDQFGLGRKR